MSQIPLYEDMYGSEYLAPEDLPRGGIRVQFYKSDVRELNCAAAQKKWKVVLYAKTADGKPMKKLVAVNKTSAKQLAKVWGKPVDTYECWMGKPADLTHVKIKAFGTMKDAVLITPVTRAVEGEPFDEGTGEVLEETPIQQPRRTQGPRQQAAIDEALDAGPEADAPESQADPLDEQAEALPSGVKTVVCVVKGVLIKKRGKNKKNEPWTMYSVQTDKGDFSTFEEDIAVYAKEMTGKHLGIDYEMDATGKYKNLIQTRAV